MTPTPGGTAALVQRMSREVDRIHLNEGMRVVCRSQIALPRVTDNPDEVTCFACDEIRRLRDALSAQAQWCRVCGHAKWHELAKASLNPVALIGFAEANRPAVLSVKRLVDYVLAVTGIRREDMDRALAQELAAPPADDPEEPSR